MQRNDPPQRNDPWVVSLHREITKVSYFFVDKWPMSHSSGKGHSSSLHRHMQCYIFGSKVICRITIVAQWDTFSDVYTFIQCAVVSSDLTPTENVSTWVVHEYIGRMILQNIQELTIYSH